MGRLFWKIFFWFWLAMILMALGVAWGLAQYYQVNETPPSLLVSRLIGPQVATVSSALQHGGESVTRKMLEDLSSSNRIQIFAVNEQGQDLLGRFPPKENINKRDLKQGEKPNKSSHQRIGLQVISMEGNRYRVFADISSSPRIIRTSFSNILARPYMRNPELIIVRFAIAIFVSGLVCFWLSWYLTKPINRLRKATKKLSKGDLNARVAKDIGKRRDEIADLGRDFDQMAEHIQSLLMTQKQLLNDVSHELRSPLTRLQVAIGLARKKSNGDIASELNRIEQESKRLDELVGQVLTLARDSANAVEAKDDYIDMNALLEDIISDARFEAAERNCGIILLADDMPIIKGNLELLRRAFENIVRNAIHHTADNTAVSVSLTNRPHQQEQIKILVCDNGPGVPEEQLEHIFEPFYRVSAGRERKSGGYGLGLAIALRAIHIHGGEIKARNGVEGGLCVEVHLKKEMLCSKIVNY